MDRQSAADKLRAIGRAANTAMSLLEAGDDAGALAACKELEADFGFVCEYFDTLDRGGEVAE